jgi:propionyl-CoA synthetase
MTTSYEKSYRQSLEDPEGFWGGAAEAIHWHKKWDRVLDRSREPFFGWFQGGMLNTCYNALDHHVENGRAHQAALIYDSPVTDTIRKISYQELLGQVSRFADVLTSLGLKKGDTAIVYMPMIPEAIVAMLACARIGVIHSVVFGGFAPPELAIRIDDAKPKVIITASCGIELKRILPYKPLLDRAIDLASHKPEVCIVFQRPQAKADLLRGRDLDWQESMAGAKPAPCAVLNATDPLYILYTSGTTGKPKGVVRDNGGHAVALKWSLPHIYDVSPGDVYWAASDIGWAVGHSYTVYGPLLLGCTSILYEGKPVGTPDPGAFWRVISQHQVKVLFTAPTAFRAIKKEDPGGAYLKKYNVGCLKYLFLAGERLDPDTYYWAKELLDIPVIDHWWQTETGWPVAANCMGMSPSPVKPGSASKPVPGYSVQVLDTAGKPEAPEREGLIAIKLPLPPGCLSTLWNDDERYVRSYMTRFPGFYFTGDGGFTDRDGYLYVMGRVDDVINVAGHRFSTGRMEEVVAKHPDVAECAVIGASDPLKGQIPVGLLVLKAGVGRDPDKVVTEVIQQVISEIGAVASFKWAYVVNRLPKTRSGKILRRTIRDIADGKPYSIPSTIDDPESLPEIETVVKPFLSR